MNFKKVEIFEPLLLGTKKTEIRLFVKPATKYANYIFRVLRTLLTTLEYFFFIDEIRLFDLVLIILVDFGIQLREVNFTKVIVSISFDFNF